MYTRLLYDEVYAKAKEKIRNGQYKEASVLLQGCITQLTSQVTHNTLLQDQISQLTLTHLECIATSKHIPYDEFYTLLISAHHRIKKLNNIAHNRHIEALVQQYEIPGIRAEYIYKHSYNAHRKPDNETENLALSPSHSSLPTLDGPSVNTPSGTTSLTTNPVSPHIILAPSLNNGGYHSTSQLSISSNKSHVEESDDDSDDANSIVSLNDALLPIAKPLQPANAKLARIKANSAVLPELKDRATLTLASTHHRLAACLRIEIPPQYVPTPSRLFIEEFDEAREHRGKANKDRLHILQDLSLHLLTQLRSGFISEEDFAERRTLLQFTHDIDEQKLGNRLGRIVNTELKLQLRDICRTISATNEHHKPELIDALTALQTVLNKMNGKDPVTTVAKTTNKRKQNPIEHKHSDLEQKENPEPTSDSNASAMNTNSHSTTGNSIFRSPFKISRPMITNDHILSAMREGDVETLSRLVGGDGTYATKLIPDNSGNTYLMFAMQCSHHVENLVAALLTPMLIDTKTLRQILRPANINSEGLCTVDLAIKHHKLDALTNGLAMATLAIGKKADTYTHIIEETANQLGHFISLNPLTP